MDSRSDILVSNQNYHPVLAVEIKTMLNASVDWAVRFRRNLLAHGHLPDTEFFLIATPDKFFIWKNVDLDSLSSAPTRVVDSRSLLASYFERANIAPEQISGSSFELIINFWLAELMYVGTDKNETNHTYQELADLGLLKAIEGGYLNQEVFA